jgi:hypothetical protein
VVWCKGGKAMTRYRCERRSQIRAGPELESDKVAVLEQKAVVVAIDTLKLPSGVTRIQFSQGWVSEFTKAGLKVMTRLEDEEDVAPEEFHAPAADSSPSQRRPRSSSSARAKSTPITTTGVQATGVSIKTVVEAHRIAHRRHGPHMVSRMIETFQTGSCAYSALDSTLTEEQQVVALLIAGDTIVGLHSLYQDLDIDHSGSVDVEDIAPMIDSAALDAQELVRIADEDESGTLTFFEFVSIYLNAISGGKLSHSSDGFVDALADVEHKVNITQIADVAEHLVQACRLHASGSQLSHALQELRKLLHEVDGGHEIHDQSLCTQRSRSQDAGTTQVDIEAIQQFQQELDLEMEHEEALQEIAEEVDPVDGEDDEFRAMTPGGAHPGTGVGPVHRARLRTNWNPQQQTVKEDQRHQELCRLYGLFPTIDSASIDSILEESGSVDGALQVLKDITGATDQIENEAIRAETAQGETEPEPAPAPPTAAAPNDDDVRIAEGVEEFPLPSKPTNLSEALAQFVEAQHVNQVDAAWKYVRELSGIPPAATGLAFFNQLKDVVAAHGRSQAFEVTRRLESKAARRKEFCKLSGQSVCVIGAGPVGLRCAVELALCGASVVVVEQRRSFTRANILKLWPFLVNDLSGLGAKIFFPQYCTGGLMHIGTRRLQQILLKDALLLGVEVHYGLQFHKLLKPNKAAGRPQWTLSLGPMVGRDGKPRDSPELHAAAVAEATQLGTRGFDSIFVGIGQQAPVQTELPNGKSRLSFKPIVEGSDAPIFELKKVQYSQALGMVTHFKNNYTIEENSIQEQGGVARQFHLEMFESLQRTTMCELENVVYYRGESHYWVMTPTIQSLEKTGVLEKVAPTREAVLAESSDEMQALLRFCFSHVNCGEIIDVTHGSVDDDDDDVGLFDLIEKVMTAKEGREITKRKVLWRNHIDDSQGQPRFHSHDRALTGKLSASAQSKALSSLADDLYRIVEDEFPQEKWPSPPAGSRLFQTHGRRGEGSTYIVDNQKMMAYARHVAGHFRPYFKQKDPATGEYTAQFTSVEEGAQIFNFDQILEAKAASKFLVHDGVACNINLIGDSLKEVRSRLLFLCQC